MNTTGTIEASREIGATSFIGRQPIFDAQRHVVGYELLFRDSSANASKFNDASQATATTVNNTLNEFGLGELIGNRLGFFNLTRKLLLEKFYTLLPAHRCIVELTDSEDIDDQVIDACRELKRAGYRLALDNFVFDTQRQKLLELADIVKIDATQIDPAQARAVIRKLNRPKLIFLAQKVETYCHFMDFDRAGCRYFQGYFFCKPDVMHARGLSAIKQHYVAFMHELMQDPMDFNALERIIKAEMSLSVKLLRYLNSAAVGLPEVIESIRQALALLGEKKLRQWGALVTATLMADDKPLELTRVCMTRARMCELMGSRLNLHDRQIDLFLLGLLSGLDALLDQPMDQALRDLMVADEIKSTLLGQATPLSNLYQLALACEQGDTAQMQQLCTTLRLDVPQVALAFRQAMHWADDSLKIQNKSDQLR